MKRKWKLFLTVSLLSMLFLYGCGNTPISDPQSTDAKFITSLSQGLETRWQIQKDYEKQWKEADISIDCGSDEHMECYTACIDAEIDAISAFADETFQNKDLKDHALAYMECLKAQKEALSYAPTDEDKHMNLWTAAFNERSTLIKYFVDEYDLSVNWKYRKNLNNILKNARAVEKDS